jgi:hypothetical protein
MGLLLYPSAEKRSASFFICVQLKSRNLTNDCAQGRLQSARPGPWYFLSLYPSRLPGECAAQGLA